MRGSVYNVHKICESPARLPRSREHAGGSIMAQEVNRSKPATEFHANVDTRDKKGVPRSLRYTVPKRLRNESLTPLADTLIRLHSRRRTKLARSRQTFTDLLLIVRVFNLP